MYKKKGINNSSIYNQNYNKTMMKTIIRNSYLI